VIDTINLSNLCGYETGTSDPCDIAFHISDLNTTNTGNTTITKGIPVTTKDSKGVNESLGDLQPAFNSLNLGSATAA
jgi:hypothetical protein